MADLVIFKCNEVQMKISAIPAIMQELNDYFKFPDPNFTPNPYSKWDGQIRLFQKSSGLIKIGLLFEVYKFAKNSGYSIELDPSLKFIQKIEDKDIKEFLDGLEIKVRDENRNYIPASARDYQFNSIGIAMRYGRCVLELATSAGKSLIIYAMTRFYRERREAFGDNSKKTLIVVPSKHLVNQLFENFQEYSFGSNWDTLSNVHTIMEGATKSTNKPIIISTWQGIQDQPKEWFLQFGDVLVDEVHTAKSDKLTYILDSCKEADMRLGMTGTLANTNLAGILVISHFGPYKKVITARELIDLGYATDIKVKMIELVHTKDSCALNWGNDYQKEMEFLISHEERNKLIVKMALTLKGNTAIMFERIDAHMMLVYEELSKVKKNVFYINGEVKIKDRVDIQAAIESGEDITLLASYGTMQQGVSIKKLHHLVLAHPSKSYIRVIQTIGRMMRMHSTKDFATVWDLIDNLRHNGHFNHALRHSLERYKFYVSEKHPVQMKKMLL